MLKLVHSSRWPKPAQPQVQPARRATKAISLAARAVVRRVHIAALTYRINSTERYMRECDRDGLIQSLNVSRFLLEQAELIADRAALRREAA